MSEDKPTYPRGMRPEFVHVDDAAFLPDGFKQAPAAGLSEDDVATLRERGFNYVHVTGQDGTEPRSDQALLQMNVDAETRPDATPAPSSAYSLGPIIQAPVTPEEVLTELRHRLNKGYMPSATGRVQYNSKPEYLRGVDNWINETHENAHGSGCYAELDPTAGELKRLWVFLCVGNVEVACQLKSDGLYVRRADITSAWEPFDRPVHMDRHLFKEVVDMYL